MSKKQNKKKSKVLKEEIVEQVVEETAEEVVEEVIEETEPRAEDPVDKEVTEEVDVEKTTESFLVCPGCGDPIAKEGFERVVHECGEGETKHVYTGNAFKLKVKLAEKFSRFLTA